MQTAISPTAIGRDLLNRARQIGTKFVTAAQPRIFDAILFLASAPRRIRFALADYAATKRADAHMGTQYQAAAMQATRGSQSDPGDAPNASGSTIIFTPPAKGLIALSRENPHLAIVTACLIMGAIQIGVVALIVFMMRDAGYSSGWGDATKYYVNCEKSAALQQWGQ
jgi:hypothetical protein